MRQPIFEGNLCVIKCPYCQARECAAYGSLKVKICETNPPSEVKAREYQRHASCIFEFGLDGDFWVKDPLPPSTFGSDYFFAELHKCDWLLTLEHTGGGVEFRPNTDYWRRSRLPILFPSPPEESEEK